MSIFSGVRELVKRQHVRELSQSRDHPTWAFPIFSHDTDSLHSMTRCFPFPRNLRQHPNRKLHPKRIGWNSKCERKGARRVLLVVLPLRRKISSNLSTSPTSLGLSKVSNARSVYVSGLRETVEPSTISYFVPLKEIGVGSESQRSAGGSQVGRPGDSKL